MRPIHNAIELIEALSIAQPAGVTELSQITGLPRSTAQRVLVSLHEAGWIEYADEKRRDWRLSLRALIVSGRAITGQMVVRNIALPVMEELRRATEETIHLMVRQGHHVVLLERLDGFLPNTQFRPLGSDALMTITATGRAILAKLPDAMAELVIKANVAEAGLPPDLVEESRQRISIARKAGYAITQGNNRAHIGAVGAAITDAEGTPFAAISASGPLSRMDKARCDQFGPRVADAAERISMGIRWTN